MMMHAETNFRSFPSGICWPAGVVFDMDGTLLDTERVSLIAWKEAEDATGCHLPEGFYETMIGQSEAGYRSRLAGVVPPGCDVDRFVREANRRYLRLLHEEPVPMKPGLAELLDFLRDHDVPVGIATSTHRHMAVTKLSQAGLLERFSVLVCGDEVLESKPHPEIFARAATSLGTDPAKTFAVEDSANGVRSATAAGLPTLLVPDIAPVPSDVRALAVGVFQDLHAVREALVKLLPVSGAQDRFRSRSDPAEPGGLAE